MADTPGQAAHDGFYAAQGLAHLAAEWPEPVVPHEAWAAAAQAVLNDAFPGLRRQVADLRRERDAARAELAEQKARMSEVLSGFAPHSERGHKVAVVPDADFDRWQKLAGIKAP